MKRILIANRGEIAARIIRSAREHGYDTVAVYADQDLEAFHTGLADTAVPLHGATAAETYLDQAKLLAAARNTRADAVHPGYGFLAENADFARAVLAAGLVWIGPSPDTIERLGDKVSARAIALQVGAPLAPGSDGPVDSPNEIHAFAEQHGLPIAIKAAHGGGGRGIRVVRQIDEIDDAFASATSEAVAAFGRGECFIERFLDRPRHIEAQVLADTHGNVVVIGTRDCSLQRRNQKLVEESPAPFLDPELRRRIIESASAICAAADYVGAATVEYLLSPDGTLSFLEVNTRLQVEHPVTEETTGIDIVAEQLRIAEGEALRVRTTPEPRAHSIEFRFNAEDPALGFVPVPGTIDTFQPPTGPGVRVDSGIRSGDTISGAFDSMFAKIIVTGPDRATTLRRARTALAEMRVEGIPTPLPFHREVLENPDFIAADGPESFRVHTRWIETEFTTELETSEYLAQAVRSREDGVRRFMIEVDGRSVQLGLPEAVLGAMASGMTGGSAPGNPADARVVDDEHAVTAPVTGALTKWLVEDGDSVEDGTPIAVIEAMKMETNVVAHRAGTFARAALDLGQTLSSGEALGRID
ncbi:acetyl/propionyl/methylcrotonyl-CoA carboxylase subunit alpha [Leucobacter sp. GX24907]